MDLSGSWVYIEQVARQRLKNNKSARHVSDYGPEIEIIGAAGELAARRFLNLTERLHTHFDDGTDIIYAGRSIDVKTTFLTCNIEYRFLQWPYWKPFNSDLVLLTAVSIERKVAFIIGYAKRVEVLNAPVNLLRAHPCYEISVKRLHPASKLLTPQAASH